MKIKVYQIDRDHDDKNVMFMGYDFTMSHGGVDPSDYKCVFDGNVECSDLEEVFTLCNEDHPIGYNGHSLSVSDIVDVGGAGSSERIIEPLKDRLVGRYTIGDVVDPNTGEVIVENDNIITEKLADKIYLMDVEAPRVAKHRERNTVLQGGERPMT